MTERQEKHLESLKAEFAAAVDAKYRAGAAEHGDDLLDADPLTICDMLMEEALDQYVYASTMKQRLRAALQKSASASVS